ncbi:hypothetical protein R6Q57_024121 [Mikania cordata]
MYGEDELKGKEISSLYFIHRRRHLQTYQFKIFNMSYDLHPGPIVDDLLFLKDSHRARDIFNNRKVTNWREKLTYKDVVSHSLRACRSQLHSLREGEVN